MKELTIYSIKVGELYNPLVDSKENTPKTFISWNDFLKFKDDLVKVMSDTNHTTYQNKCYAEFLLRKIGLKY